MREHDSDQEMSDQQQPVAPAKILDVLACCPGDLDRNVKARWVPIFQDSLVGNLLVGNINGHFVDSVSGGWGRAKSPVESCFHNVFPTLC